MDRETFKMKCGEIIGTHGTGLLSEAIEWYTHSKYSHIRVAVSDTEFIEATWPKVRKGNISELKEYKAGEIIIKTPIDPLTQEEQTRLILFLTKKIGKRYDWQGLISFLVRKNVQNKNWYFCNELVEEAYISIDRKLVGGNPSWHTPDDLMNSLLLKDA